MNKLQRIGALCRIKVQLENYMGSISDEYARLHGTKELNETYQLAKKLLAYEILSDEITDDFSDEACTSLGIDNIS